MSKFTEWSAKTGVPVWVFFAACAVAGVVVVKLLLL
jgi:hypothetical protein